MPGCAAFGCTNSAKKGFLMKLFPRDKTRRALWAANVQRQNWTPTDTSRLCEKHFTDDQWEKTRVDGQRKLKCNAVPTVFPFVSSEPKRKSPAKRNSQPARRNVVAQQDGLIASLQEVATQVENNVASNVERSLHETNPASAENSDSSTVFALEKKQKEYKKHFAEKARVNGKRKQKGTAGPTVSSFIPRKRKSTKRNPLSAKRRKVFVQQDGLIVNLQEVVTEVEINAISNGEKSQCEINPVSVENGDNSKVLKPTNVEIYAISNVEEPQLETNPIGDENCDNSMALALEKLKECEDHTLQLQTYVRQLQATVRNLQLRLKAAHMANARLRAKTPIEEALRKIFTPDQMMQIVSKKRVQKWSTDSIRTALRLKLACGRTGYEALLKLKLPFPSLRTLRRSLQDFKFSGR